MQLLLGRQAGASSGRCIGVSTIPGSTSRSRLCAGRSSSTRTPRPARPCGPRRWGTFEDHPKRYELDDLCSSNDHVLPRSAGNCPHDDLLRRGHVEAMVVRDHRTQVRRRAVRRQWRCRRSLLVVHTVRPREGRFARADPSAAPDRWGDPPLDGRRAIQDRAITVPATEAGTTPETLPDTRCCVFSHVDVASSLRYDQIASSSSSTARRITRRRVRIGHSTSSSDAVT